MQTDTFQQFTIGDSGLGMGSKGTLGGWKKDVAVQLQLTVTMNKSDVLPDLKFFKRS